jgi:hypothetical protein
VALELEHKGEKLLSRVAFLKRLAGYAGFAFLIVLGSLAIGMCGYHYLESLSWLDAFLNAAMILGGMGPVNELHTSIGKLFAGCYALFSGLIFLVVAGTVFAPVAHRIMHRFHVEE